MSSNGDCSLRKDWCEEVDDEESLSSNNQERVGHKHDCFHGNGTHVGQVKDKLEEELARLALVMTENKHLVQDTLTCIQETDEELKMNLTILRAHLKRSNDDKMPQEEVINWDVMEQRIITALTGLERCPEKLKLNPHFKVADLRELFRARSQMKMGKTKEMETRLSTICYYCYEKGHYKDKCPHLYNRNQWMQTPAFEQKMAFRQKHNSNEMHETTSMSWPVKESNDVNVITAGQNGRDNARVSYNPLN